MKHIISAIVPVFMLASCGWLDITPENTIDEEDLFSTGYGFRNALNGIYLELGNTAVYGENMSWGFLSAVAQEYLTDNSSQGENTLALCRDAADFVYNSTNTQPVIAEIWETQYSIIANVNKILEHINDLPESGFAYGNDERNMIRGEALALRAMLHFDLLRLFAPAPSTSPAGTYIPYREEFSHDVGEKLSVQQFLEKVIKDINAAEPYLKAIDTEFHPAAMYASMMATPTTAMSARYRFDSSTFIDEMGQFFWFRGWRLNYMALLGLKARVCMYAGSGYHSIARAAAMELYTSFYNDRQWVGFTPSDDITCQIESRHTKMSDDVLFGVYYRNLATDFESMIYGADNSVKLPLANIEDLFASDNTGVYEDWRLKYTVAQTNTSEKSWYTLKYNTSSEAVVTAVENPMIPVIRLSEVMYILAELSAEQGDVEHGIQYLETVRRARGAQRSLSTTVSTPEQLMDEIILDARKDFLCEGNMFYMYKRLNITEVPSASESGAMKDMTAGYVLPVPTSESPF